MKIISIEIFASEMAELESLLDARPSIEKAIRSEMPPVEEDEEEFEIEISRTSRKSNFFPSVVITCTSNTNEEYVWLVQKAISANWPEEARQPCQWLRVHESVVELRDPFQNT